jgi:nucleotide-binding universal stress UspA family protein
MLKVPGLLVPFDGSAAAEQVLRYACRVSLAEYAHLTVLCVAALPEDGVPAAIRHEVEASVMHALVQAQNVCQEEGVAASFHFTYATDLAEAIIAEARRSGAALICLSLDEHRRGETALMSPAVQAVLAAAPASVLLTDPAAELPPTARPRGNGDWRATCALRG